MSFSGGCLRECDFFEEFSDLFEYFSHLKESTTTIETLKILKNTEKSSNDNVY